MSDTVIYAKGTPLPVEKTKADIDLLLQKHGASERGILTQDREGKAIICFALSGGSGSGGGPLKFKLEIPLPRRDAFFPPSGREPRGWAKTWCDAERQLWVDQQHAQASRERWRSVLLLLKAKLEAVKLGLSSHEEEFAAQLLLPGGATVKDKIQQLLQQTAERRLTA